MDRIVSAQRLKNNELQNRLNELKLENEKLLDENKILKRMHKREEIAIRRFENQDNDIARIVKNHVEEGNVLKDTIKKLKNDNKKLYNQLIDKDEEIRSLRKKLDEMKKILSEKKIMDIVELNKLLEQTKKDFSIFKEKCDVRFYFNKNKIIKHLLLTNALSYFHECSAKIHQNFFSLKWSFG